MPALLEFAMLILAFLAGMSLATLVIFLWLDHQDQEFQKYMKGSDAEEKTPSETP